MKHFTHITTGIVLGLAVMFTGIGQAKRHPVSVVV